MFYHIGHLGSYHNTHTDWAIHENQTQRFTGSQVERYEFQGD